MTNEPRWTRGPWRFAMGGTDLNWPQVTVAGDDRELIVARTYDPAAEDNAHLIAAAPDLFEALVAYQRANRVHNDTEAALYEKAKAALAKALAQETP